MGNRASEAIRRNIIRLLALLWVSPDEALRAASRTRPEKAQAMRAAMRIPQDKIGIFKEKTAA